MSLVEFSLPEWLSDTSVAQIQEQILSHLPDDIDKVEGGFIWDMTVPVAIEKSELLEYWLVLALKSMHHMWAKGIWLDYHAWECSLQRRAATYAYGDLTVEGTAGVVIPAGFIFSVPSENFVAAIDFETLEEVTIPDEGVVTIRIKAVESGTNSNVDKDTITIMKNPIKGITSIKNFEALSGGTAAEDDESLRARIDAYYAGRGDSYVGNRADYIRWAQSVDGIGYANCLPCYAGPNTVKVVVTDANGEPANDELVAAVELYIFGTDAYDINRLAPVGIVQHEVSAPTLVTIDYQADLWLEADATVELVTKLFKENLKKHYLSLSVSGMELAPVQFVRTAAVLSATAGVADFKHFRMNGTRDNIYLADDEYPITGEISFNIMETNW